MSFSTWLMFRPDGDGAIDVPVRRIDWDWSGKAAIIDGEWQVIDAHRSPDPSSVETTDFPRWTHNIDYDPPQFQ
jgi:hypothetical protein